MKEQKELAARKKRIDAGSTVSAIGLVFCFAGQAAGLPPVAIAAVTILAFLAGVWTLVSMLLYRRGHKGEMSGNRILGQAALLVLLAGGVASAVRLVLL